MKVKNTTNRPQFINNVWVSPGEEINVPDNDNLETKVSKGEVSLKGAKIKESKKGGN